MNHQVFQKGGVIMNVKDCSFDQVFSLIVAFTQEEDWSR